ncbi:MAG: NrfD/PsrC family molybdoenzyme membrane anchor subunit [Anaerolineales bacterium]
MIAAVRSFKLRPIHIWMAMLAVITGIGAVAGIIVFAKGLVLTNMTDLVPWGLWITIDLSAIALSAGAFTLCALVYLLGFKQYQPIARTATYVGLIGYSIAMLTLLLDIGRPDRFWHYLAFWNTHSVLWEVSICLTLYIAVLFLETLPIIGRVEYVRTRWPGLSSRLESIHHLAPYLAVAGLFLSLLHQSSLGAIFGVLIAKPIWYRPGLSLLFIISAVAGGMSLTVFISMLASRLSRKIKVQDDLLERLAMIVGWILVGYLYFRFWDAFSMTYTYEPGRTEGLALLTKGPLALNFWMGEILFGAVIPIVLLLNPRTRALPWVRMLALLMVVGGVVAYRWDTILSGSMVILTYLPNQIQTLYTSYTPSLIEILAGAGVVAYGMLAITIGIRYLNIVDHSEVQLEPVLEETYALGSAD